MAPLLGWFTCVSGFRPSNRIVSATPSIFRAICSTRSMTRVVGSWVVPSGVWTVTMR